MLLRTRLGHLKWFACVAMPHEKQEGVVFIAPADVCIMKSTSEISHEATEARMWTDEFDKSYDPNAGELPPYTGRGECYPKLTPAKMMFSKLAPKLIKRTSIKPIVAEGDTSLEEIAKGLGEPIIIGLDPMAHPKADVQNVPI